LRIGMEEEKTWFKCNPIFAFLAGHGDHVRFGTPPEVVLSNIFVVAGPCILDRGVS
jgi:hypothetical protein